MNITNFTISDIINGYKEKKFSVSEVVDAYLERIEKFNPELNIFLTIDAENARKKALRLSSGQANNNQPLFGVPIGIKDMFLTKGVRTTASSRVLENYIPPYSATAV